MEPIEAAMARGAWVEALDLALAAWRETRAPELAATIETLGPRAQSGPLRGGRGDKEAFHAAWLALAAGRRAADLDPLLEGFARDAAPLTYRARIDLMQALPSDYSPERRMRVAGERFEVERLRVLRERTAALRAFAPDPRLATAMLDLLRRAPWSGDDVYAPVLDLVVHAGDPRAVAALEGLLEGPTTRKSWVRRWLAEALPAAITDLRAVAPEHVAPVAVSGPAATPTSTADEATLLAEVLAAPHDDGPREVLADFLLERQDPRGEFIALQLATARGAGTTKGLQRTGSLLRRHEAEWLGPLALVLSGREFRRGFLDAAHLSANSAADERVWASAPDDPRLRTLRVLRKGRGNEQHLTAFLLACARHPALLRAEVPTRRALDALLALDVESALQRLELGIQPTRPQLVRLASEKGPLSAVTEVAVTADLDRTVAAFRAGPLPRRLRSIEVVLPPPDSLRGRPAHAAFFATRLPVPTVALSTYAVRVSVTGDEALVESSWRGGVPELVRALPEGLARVTLRPHPDWPLAGPEVTDVTQLRPVLEERAREVIVEPPFV